MRTIQPFRIICWSAVISLTVLGTVRAQEEDDTKAILALAEIGAQLQLNDQRIIGVTLRGEEVDDESLKLLRGLDRLQTLTLDETKVTGKGLKHLQKLTLLGSLTIHYSPISDRDIDELAALKSVVNYDLRGTNISDMGKQRLTRLLRTAEREATVRLHFGGFFGVAGTIGGENCLLTNVVPDSSAHKAGLEVGDIIRKFDGQVIDDFPELASAVALTPPEQPVPVEIERGGETMKFTVTLRRGTAPAFVVDPPP